MYYINIVGEQRDFEVGSNFALQINLSNLTNSEWNSAGEFPIFVSYHWCDTKDNLIVWDGLRTSLSRSLRSGESIDLDVTIAAPDTPGTYRLEIDIVSEGRYWFSRSYPGVVAKTDFNIYPMPNLAPSQKNRDLVEWEIEHLNFIDASDLDTRIIRTIRPFTMTTPARILALLSAIRHLVTARIPGDFVECGVWRGGAAMAMALMLQELKDVERKLFLYDTFMGMPPPGELDENLWGESAIEKHAAQGGTVNGSEWARASIGDVRHNLASTGFPADRYSLIQGKVEESLPEMAPAHISLLRLDTDWYKSTKHELKHLVPRMSKGAIVIVDDYGHWKGSRCAVDEFIEELPRKPYLHRIDYAARMWFID